MFLHGVYTDGFAVINKKFHNFVESEMLIAVLTKTAEIFECIPSSPNFSTIQSVFYVFYILPILLSMKF
jgi:hypothetical protein